MVKDKVGVIMKIAYIIEEFLVAQDKRLQPRTFRQYDYVMDSFSIYLNGYGLNHVNEEKENLVKKGSSFTECTPIETLNYYHYSEFFEYFLVRKMLASESEMKQAVTVLRKFANWLFAKSYISSEKRDDLLSYFKDGQSQSLANSQKVSDLLYELSLNPPAHDYEQILSDYFMIEKIKPGKLWMVDFYTDGDVIGPIIVTKEISTLVEKQWEISLTIGKHKNNWYVIESGNVYP